MTGDVAMPANKLQRAHLFTMPASQDNRGAFIKDFSESRLHEAGISFTLRESYFSFSKKNVIRGMHFQLPPHQHSKIVFCPQGAILDVIVDLRKGADTYGQYFAHELTSDNHKAIYIPEGFAHGFKALTDDAMTFYLVSTEYNKDHDTGIRYDSFGYEWGLESPVISGRDSSFVTLADFDSPF